LIFPESGVAGVFVDEVREEGVLPGCGGDYVW
jgi:hypothetical protein